MTNFGEQTLAATVHSDPARFGYLFGRGPAPQAPTQEPAPGSAQESDPAAPPAGDGQPCAAPGAEQGEAGPAVEHTTDAGEPMAPCLQPMAHGVWEDARGPLPAECDVPEHHEAATDGEPQS